MDTTSERPQRSTEVTWTLFLASLLGAIASYLVFRDFLFEDAYITLRYAENLATGQGLAFQSGEAVLGTSSPLWAMVLALMIALGIPPELSLNLGYGAALAGLGLTGGVLLARLVGGSSARGWAATFPVAIALGFARLHSYWGMETPLFLALLFGAWVLVLDRRYVGCGLVLGLACLTRYEGYGFAAALACMLLAGRAMGALRSGGIAIAAVTVPWLATAWAYYGSPIPSTAGAKAGHVSHLRYLERSFQDLPQNLAWPVRSGSEPYIIGWILAVLVGIFGLVGVVRLVKARAMVALALPLGALFVFAGLIYLAPGPIFAWHRAPLHYVALLLALVGLGAVLERSPWKRVPAVITRGWWLLALLAAVPTQRAAHRQLSRTFQYAGREAAYGEIAAFLRGTGLHELTLLTWEPGYLAFQSGTRVLDLVGLVTKAPDFTKRAMSTWDSEFPPEADLVLLRAPYRPEGFELVFQGTMGAWLFVRTSSLPPYEESIEAYRAVTSAWNPDLAPQPISAEPAMLEPSFDGPPFMREGPGDLVRIDPEQEQMSLTAETPLFVVDVPALSTQFQSSSPGEAQLQLVVRGEVVLTTDGSLDPTATSVEWDVSPWLGRAARVRVLVLAGRGAVATFGKVAPLD